MWHSNRSTLTPDQTPDLPRILPYTIENLTRLASVGKAIKPEERIGAFNPAGVVDLHHCRLVHGCEAAVHGAPDHGDNLEMRRLVQVICSCIAPPLDARRHERGGFHPAPVNERHSHPVVRHQQLERAIAV